jgi:hypothetical protein
MAPRARGQPEPDGSAPVIDRRCALPAALEHGERFLAADLDRVEYD